MKQQRHCRVCGKPIKDHGPSDPCRRIDARPQNSYTKRHEQTLIKHWRTSGDGQ